MPCIIRQVVQGQFENFTELAPGDWSLQPQIEALETWLKDSPERLDAKQEWVADIGFCSNKEAAGGGPPISRDLMRLCLESNMEIYLSEYPGG